MSFLGTYSFGCMVFHVGSKLYSLLNFAFMLSTSTLACWNSMYTLVRHKLPTLLLKAVNSLVVKALAPDPSGPGSNPHQDKRRRDQDIKEKRQRRNKGETARQEKEREERRRKELVVAPFIFWLKLIGLRDGSTRNLVYACRCTHMFVRGPSNERIAMLSTIVRSGSTFCVLRLCTTRFYFPFMCLLTDVP